MLLLKLVLLMLRLQLLLLLMLRLQLLLLPFRHKPQPWRVSRAVSMAAYGQHHPHVFSTCWD